MRVGCQWIIKQPVVIFFSVAYLAAASLTMGAITLSSLVYQSDVYPLPIDGAQSEKAVAGNSSTVGPCRACIAHSGVE
jgi:hypothetical protein